MEGMETRRILLVVVAAPRKYRHCIQLCLQTCGWAPCSNCIRLHPTTWAGPDQQYTRCIHSAGAGEIPGLTDTDKPRMRGPKRASKIRKLFNLSKDDDVRKYVNTYRTVKEKDGKKHSKAPKIQRLVTPLTLQRKRHRRAIKRERINKVMMHEEPCLWSCHASTCPLTRAP